MEICILKFDDTHGAEDALKEVADARADRSPWLHDVGVISRPFLGRLTIKASYQEGSPTYRERDAAKMAGGVGAYTGYLLGMLAGPFRAALLANLAGDEAEDRAAAVEKKLLHIDEIKDLLPRGSSALVLVADTPVCDEMVAAFKDYDPKVVRRGVEQELQRRLRGFFEQTLSQLKEEAAQPSPPTH